jgi:hypothetical protein
LLEIAPRIPTTFRTAPTQLALAADKRNITRAEMIRTLVRENLMEDDRKNEVTG